MKCFRIKLSPLLPPIILLVLLSAASMAVGSYDIDWRNVFVPGSIDGRVFLHLRLGRTLTASFGGAALAAAGSVYQTVFRNPLASPDITGVAAGCSTGAAAAIVLFSSGLTAVSVSAFIGGLSAVLCVFVLSSFSKRGGTLTLILSGIAVNSLFQSLLMILKLSADTEQKLAAVEYWLMGSFSAATTGKFLGVLPFFVIGFAVLAVLGRQTMLLSFGDDDAEMLGVPVKAVRTAVLTASTLLTAAVVSVSGIISFIGLLSPHISRLLTHGQRRVTTALSAVIGADLLLASDIAVRLIGTSELPVGVVTSLFGAPLLFALASRRRYSDE